MPGWRSLGDGSMGRDSQDMEMFETPAANLVLCIIPSHELVPECWRDRGAQHPALGALGSTCALGCVL